ncbi:YCF48-related protein [Pseudomonas sp.]|uniref:WD40/YVTN/BNR-like repeat-containing protein n=1 Tax=Pseudomonas sp. TaxID=306 RepID=UPI003FA71799
MREPKRRAPSLGIGRLASAPHKGSKSSFLFLFSVLGLSLAVGCGYAGVAQAKGSAELRPAVLSPKAGSSLLLDVAQAGPRLVAVGVRGHVLYSDDQGATWIQAQVPVRQMLTGLHFVDDRHGWAVGHDSIILHTSDAGATWSVQYRDPGLDGDEEADLLEKPLMDVWFRDANTGFAVGAYGLLLRTDDGGATWDDRSDDIDNPDGLHYNAIAEVAGAGLMVVGEMGSLYRSPDYGDSWEALNEHPYDGSWFGVSGTGEANAVLVWGLRGNMYRSDDFGASWTQVALETPAGPLEATLSGGSLTADGRLVVVGAGGVVISSMDRGRTFSVTTRPDRVGLANGALLADGQLLLVGQRGAVKASQADLTAKTNR